MLVSNSKNAQGNWTNGTDDNSSKLGDEDRKRHESSGGSTDGSSSSQLQQQGGGFVGNSRRGNRDYQNGPTGRRSNIYFPRPRGGGGYTRNGHSDYSHYSDNSCNSFRNNHRYPTNYYGNYNRQWINQHYAPSRERQYIPGRRMAPSTSSSVTHQSSYQEHGQAHTLQIPLQGRQNRFDSNNSAEDPNETIHRYRAAGTAPTHSMLPPPFNQMQPVPSASQQQQQGNQMTPRKENSGTVMHDSENKNNIVGHHPHHQQLQQQMVQNPMSPVEINEIGNRGFANVICSTENAPKATTDDTLKNSTTAGHESVKNAESAVGSTEQQLAQQLHIANMTEVANLLAAGRFDSRFLNALYGVHPSIAARVQQQPIRQGSTSSQAQPSPSPMTLESQLAMSRECATMTHEEMMRAMQQLQAMNAAAGVSVPTSTPASVVFPFPPKFPAINNVNTTGNSTPQQNVGADVTDGVHAKSFANKANLDKDSAEPQSSTSQTPSKNDELNSKPNTGLSSPKGSYSSVLRRGSTSSPTKLEDETKIKENEKSQKKRLSNPDLTPTCSRQGSASSASRDKVDDTSSISSRKDKLNLKISTENERSGQNVSRPPPPPAALISPTGQYQVSKLDVLSENIWHYHNKVSQTETTLNRKLHLRDMLYIAISPVFPMCGLYVVGSSLNGFGNNSSDMDLCLMITNKELDQRTDAVVVLNMILHTLQHEKFVTSQKLILAKVPILRIKFEAPFDDIQVDLNANNSVAIKNTHLLCYYSSFDWRVRPIVSVVKEWAKRKGINDAKKSSFTSYSLVLLVIHYLQCGADPAVLPTLQKMYPSRFSNKCDVRTLNVTLPLQPAPEQTGWRYNEQATLGELLIGFLDYYANKFDYNSDAISIRQGRRIERAQVAQAQPKKGSPTTTASSSASSSASAASLAQAQQQMGANAWRSQWRCICIEEPFTNSNTAHSIYDEMVFGAIKEAFQEAHRELEQTRDLNRLMDCQPISVTIPHSGAVVYDASYEGERQPSPHNPSGVLNGPAIGVPSSSTPHHQQMHHTQHSNGQKKMQHHGGQHHIPHVLSSQMRNMQPIHAGSSSYQGNNVHHGRRHNSNGGGHSRQRIPSRGANTEYGKLIDSTVQQQYHHQPPRESQQLPASTVRECVEKTTRKEDGEKKVQQSSLSTQIQRKSSRSDINVADSEC